MIWVYIFTEALLLSTHNICFHGEIRKKYLSGYPSYLELLICSLVLNEKKKKGSFWQGKAIRMRSQNIRFHGEINIAPDKMWYPQNIFLFLHENMLWYSWDVPQWDASNEYHNIWRNKKNVGAFQLQKMLFSCKKKKYLIWCYMHKAVLLKTLLDEHEWIVSIYLIRSNLYPLVQFSWWLQVIDWLFIVLWFMSVNSS